MDTSTSRPSNRSLQFLATAALSNTKRGYVSTDVALPLCLWPDWNLAALSETDLLSTLKIHIRYQRRALTCDFAQYERIPDNWYKRPVGDEYTIPGYVLSAFADPCLSPSS